MYGTPATFVTDSDDPDHPLDAVIASYFDNPTDELTRYFLSCRNDWFRVQRFAEFCRTNGLVLRTALFPSKETDLKCFKKHWDRLRSAFFRKHGAVMAFAMIEREIKGENVGRLHAHAILAFPAWIDTADIGGGVCGELHRSWTTILRRHGGCPKRCPTTLIEPFDGSGDAFRRYMCKVFNRGPFPARSGREKNQTYHLTANLPTLWRSDELPRRCKAPNTVIAELRKEFGKNYGGKIAA